MCFVWQCFSKPRDTQVTAAEFERCPVWLVADVTSCDLSKQCSDPQPNSGVSEHYRGVGKNCVAKIAYVKDMVI
jgi:hypothetical protein